jgi:lambda repressor-like predicted transcriptional regulator
MMNKTPQPSPELYAQVRAGFVKQGTSLNQWCIAHGIHRQSARKVLLGEWKGPTATLVMTALLEASRYERMV